MPTPVPPRPTDHGDSVWQRKEYALATGLPGLLDALANHLLSSRPLDPYAAISAWAQARSAESEGFAEDDVGTYSTNVAEALCRYDLELAGDIVDKRRRDGDYSALDLAFLALRDNLVEYLPYLPDELFDDPNSTPGGTPRAIPDSPLGMKDPRLSGSRQSKADLLKATDQTSRVVSSAPQPAPAPSGELAIVFTDIQGSSQLWGAKTAAMQKGLRLHNNLLRSTLLATNGYEVKTLGDAFMVAFQDIMDALRFAQRAQLALVEVDWPKDLLDHPICQPVPLPDKGQGFLWRGLRVRMGIHFGPASVEVNPVTSRADYFGPTVNIAARVEAQSVGGATAVTRPVLACVQSLDQEARAALANPEVTPLGLRELKGCGEEELTLVLPARLARRADILQQREKEQQAAAAQKKAADSGRPRPGQLGKDPQSAKEEAHKGLRGARATVAAVKLDPVPLQTLWPGAKDAAMEQLQYSVGALEVAAARSEGQLQMDAGGSALIVWNAARPCTMHAAQSVRFLGLLRHEATKGKSSVGTRVGIAAGSLVHCITGQHKRHCVHLGGVVDMARLLSGAAAELGAFCLSAGCGGARGLGQEQQFKSHARPVDYWPTHDGSMVQVDEMDADGISQVWSEGTMVGFVGMGGPAGAPGAAAASGGAGSAGADAAADSRPGWGAAYLAAFRKADSGQGAQFSGDPQELEQLAESTPMDIVLRRVAELKREGRRLVTKLPAFLNPHVGRQRGAAVRGR
eukprot:TRINITY_DN11473_c0_g1_i1.p1 TRINITY_DN11473_c0_g1~~TRINITY_DN11473_c0_g1_i1.p1  ORF type:complete len:768 (+),score=216.11 TRINITY_DN11473_c0_g1_i1:77-2305(+)